MAIYVEIKKTDEQNDIVEYAFGTADNNMGKLILNKTSGEITIIAKVPNDPDSKIVSRVKYKLTQHWKKGEIPEKTCWAS